ncbi:OmpA family protein [Adhaeribacter aquaticus]|uniref:OmpA family protein n=1 Tax=Adhaeribacter aquaticus TaxID=299567 RepID=UPI0003FA9DDC|nr:OmpA family protein [Adhaeribacter aquaticus]
MVSKIYLVLVVLSLTAMVGCSSLSNVGRADKYFAREEFEPAVRFYLKAVKNKQRDGILNLKLAEAYRRSNRIQLAEPYYKAALDNGVKREDTNFYYGMALRANGKYDEAATHLAQYLQIGANQKFLDQAKLEIQNLKALPTVLKNKLNYEVIPLDHINSEAADFGVSMAEGEIIFASSRGAGPTFKGNGQGFTDLYGFKPSISTDFLGTGSVRKLDNMLNLSGIHDAVATFSADGKTVIFARGNEGTRKGRQNVDLFVSRFRSGAWTEPRAPRLNSPDAWDSTPFLAPDGKTLYFASNRKGGQGGTDIYRSVLDASGNFSAPENVGAPINTPGNESFPSVGPDGTLYFASDGHLGLGKLDLYKVENNQVVNLGPEINSTGDDFALYPVSEDSGYFSSEREGGKGSDDIYFFRKSPIKRVDFWVDVKVLEQLQTGGGTREMADVRVTLLDAQGKRIEDARTPANGLVSFDLDTASTYSLLAERNGYFAARQAITTVGKTPSQASLTKPLTEIRLSATLTLNPIIKNKAIVVENIFYDLDKADIRPDAALELDKLVQTLRDNPKITIELSSHTDVRGKDAYNMDLSERRARSAVEYIISKGIEPARITAKGYGETRLVVKNAKTEEEHQRNRRTEFKVTKIAE